MNYCFPAPEIVAVPVRGGDPFPVREIYCVGRNYWEHRKEMGFEDRDPPFFFKKGRYAIVNCVDGVEAEIPYPPETRNLHHEIELVAAIGKEGFRIPKDRALEHVHGYAVGLDMTRRDLQIAMREKGRPWDAGKNFEASAPIGAITPAAEVGDLKAASIWLGVNGEERQRAGVDEMIWDVAEVIEDLSRFFRLYPGDLIYTGTPAGVGPVVAGDVMAGGVDGLGEIRVRLM